MKEKHQKHNKPTNLYGHMSTFHTIADLIRPIIWGNCIPSSHSNGPGGGGALSKTAKVQGKESQECSE